MTQMLISNQSELKYTIAYDLYKEKITGFKLVQLIDWENEKIIAQGLLANKFFYQDYETLVRGIRHLFNQYQLNSWTHLNYTL